MIIFHSIFGSRLYGTATPTSDIDKKTVVLPTGRDIVLQRAKQVNSQQRPKAEFEKNVAGEVEEEAFSLQKYLHLLSEGQTVALDMLFTPSEHWLMTPDPIWFEILANKDRLVTSKAAAFVGYCRQQANKYGVKGSRVAAARNALALLTDSISFHGNKTKIETISLLIDTVISQNLEYMKLVDIDQPNSGPIRHWEICGRKLPFNSSLKNGFEIISKLLNEYGNRTLKAEQEGGVDWKAMSHAVRIADEAIELLTTGHITFPLKRVNHILDIKTGKLTFHEVAEEIESLLEVVEKAQETSFLPENPDYEWIDDFVYKVYRERVLNA